MMKSEIKSKLSVKTNIKGQNFTITKNSIRKLFIAIKSLFFV